MKNVYIYALIDPRNDQVRYIGKANNPEERYTNHFNSARDKNTHKRNWINSVRNDGYRPELLILDQVSGILPFLNDPLLAKLDPSPHNKGKKWSKEVIDKIRDKLIGIPNVNSYKPIIQYDLNYIMLKKYKCIKDAVDESNGFFSSAKISACCVGKRKHHREFIWKYDDGKDFNKIEINLLEKQIIQFDKSLNEINRYPSIKIAENETNIHSANICACCRGKVKTAGGYIWKYI